MRWKRWTRSEYQPVLDAVAQEHAVGIKDIKGATRRAHVVAARKDAALRLRALGMPLPQIAAAINRDISSVDAYIYPTRLERKRRQAEMREMAGLSA